MRILIEGIDRSGKTEILQKVAKHYGAISIKQNYRPKVQADSAKVFDMYDYLADLTDDEDQMFIFDRFHLSEFVFCAKRGYEIPETNLGDFEWDSLGDSLNVLILITADVDVIRARFESAGEDYVDPDEVEMLMNRYEKFFKLSELQHKLRLINNTYDDQSTNVKRIIDFINMVKGDKK